MLRLDPALPPLWRTAEVIQFGVDEPIEREMMRSLTLRIA